MYSPSPHLADAINHSIVQSEIEGGVDLNYVPVDTVLEVQTLNRWYTIVHKGSGQALISGHPLFCPEPVLVDIHGSTWGGSMLMKSYIGRGMRLEFRQADGATVTTSRILEIQERAPRSRAA
jgi:hypothetical protein